MIRSLIHRVLKHRHFWRYATFSEIAELYASRVLRMFAIHLAGGFASVYLYQSGYSLVFIAAFWVCFYGFKALLGYPIGRAIGWIGPKHAILLANIISIPAMVAIALAPQFGVVAIAVWGILSAVSSSMYNIAYMIDFSKIKDVKFGGRELGYMHILEKIANGLSPLLGGFIAYAGGPEATMIVSAIMYILAALPLLLTGEPVQTKQRVVFKQFPWRSAGAILRAELSIGFDVFTAVTVWPLFLVTSVLATSGNDTYAVIGVLTFVSVIAAIIFARVFGALVDTKKGQLVLRYATLGKMVMQLLRPTTTTTLGAGAMNIAAETVTVAQQIAMSKGIFHTVDESGRRVAYLTLLDISQNVGAVLAATTILLSIMALEQTHAFYLFFIVAAGMSLLPLLVRFKIYQ